MTIAEDLREKGVRVRTVKVTDPSGAVTFCERDIVVACLWEAKADRSPLADCITGNA